ncbi:MAG: asparagine synthetase B [Sphingobacteriales bacterium]|jgi:hypothetical protein|nr:asparagine synthetase B [Sphingobacteriales bacterium]MBK8678634.1 asparagine synthetase B [Sphingobacteriales bacterium]MBL0248569.1 asparagine synthetase B [Sphingobacteriales bacterium]MDA0199037.1 asparagine synthetase B [Bacteroidota bacterium]
MLRAFVFVFICFFVSKQSFASYLLIPMDEKQKNHLKGYGVAYRALTKEVKVDWLLNYRGGSFGLPYDKDVDLECRVKGVSFEVLTDGQYGQIVTEILQPDVNMDVVKLEKVPKVAVYSPKSKPHHPDLPWDDAVTMVLKFAEIPFDLIYDDEILNEVLTLKEYDWLHLHHEDFTGQYGRFYRNYKNADWYIDQVKYEESKARQFGFKKVSEMKLAVAKKIQQYVAGGGFMFAMCSATDSYDIALAADGVDICESMFDGDPADPQAQSKLNYNNCLAFENFKLERDPYKYEFSDIDVSESRSVQQNSDYFTLFRFSAKWDPVPTMLCQNHTDIIKGFMGQSTAFRKDRIKKDVMILGELASSTEARYIHSEFGKGFWTFYGGHDPEDYRHMVGEPETVLDLHPNSPGYRLILNNVLFPAAKKKKQKT